MKSTIGGTGSYVPDTIINNESFLNNTFYDSNGNPLTEAPAATLQRFQEITGIRERRYLDDSLNLSDIAAIAGSRALEDAQTLPEELDLIIVAHNFGNVNKGNLQVDLLPAIAARVKHLLGIVNPNCVAFDLIFGCPGWIQALIVAGQYIACGEARRVLVIGGDTLSRVVDPYDRDGLLFADGAAAAVLHAVDNHLPGGFLSNCSQTYSQTEAFYLYSGPSNKKDEPGNGFIKMNGRKVYEFALKHVPAAMKHCLDKAGVTVEAVKKIFLHQANEKMDEAILQRFYALYGRKAPAASTILPMNIHRLSNTSVASIPLLLDAVRKKKDPEHQLQSGDVILMASVGAGMNINAVTYAV